MLAYVNTPNGAAAAELVEVDAPTAAPNGVVIETRAFSLNRGELALLASRPQGWLPGQDIAGTVVRTTEDGSGPEMGSRVVALVEGAGWADLVAAPTDRVATLPDSVSFATAASLPIAGLTALRTLRLGGSLLGRRVFITGASGGVGNLASQLARNAGASVSSASAVTDDVEGAFDLILESVGGRSLAAAINHVAPGGVIVVFGNSSGEATPVSLYDFVGREGARLQTYFSYRSGMPEAVAADLAVLVDQVARGNLTPAIGFEGNWRELAMAINRLRERHIQGKAILHVG